MGHCDDGGRNFGLSDVDFRIATNKLNFRRCFSPVLIVVLAAARASAAAAADQ